MVSGSTPVAKFQPRTGIDHAMAIRGDEMNELDRLVEATILQITPDNFAKTLTVKLRSADKASIYIVLVNGVHDAVVQDMRLNNIVDEVICYSGAVDNEVLAKLQVLITGDSGLYKAGRFPHLDCRVEEVRNGDMSLWEFCPVYGAHLLVLAKSLSLTAAEAKVE